MRLFRSICGRVPFGIVSGFLAGVLFPASGIQLGAPGDASADFVERMVAPAVVCTVVVGVVPVDGVKAVGRTGLKTLVSFELASTVAPLPGILFVDPPDPDSGLDAAVASLDAGVPRDVPSLVLRPHSEGVTAAPSGVRVSAVAARAVRRRIIGA